MQLALKNGLEWVNSKQARNIAIGMTLVACIGIACAGTTGAEFKSFFDLMNNWAKGYLGKAIAIAAFVLGAGIGMAKQDVVPALTGLGFAIVFTVGPNVINAMMTALH